jgi:hypothetical protein
MGKVLKIVGGTFIAMAGGLVLAPSLFSDEVAQFAKGVVNDFVVDSDVDFTDCSLTIWKSFPNLQAGLDNITVIGKGKFAGDTLLRIGKLRADLDIMSALNNDVQVNGVQIDDIYINGIVASDSSANWNIVNLAADTTATETADTVVAAPLKLNLKKIEITNARLAYTDSTSNIRATIDGLDTHLKATMTGNVMDLTMDLAIKALGAKVGKVTYLKDAGMSFDARAKADLDSMKFTFDENKLTFAGLPLAFDGWVQMKDSSIAMDMMLMALQTQFKTIMDLLPEDVMKSVAGLKTSGEFQLYAMAKGEYKDDKHLPMAEISLKVSDGYVKYPDLPKSLDDINLDLKVNTPGGDLDRMTLKVERLHFGLGGNPFDVTAEVVRPISNPKFKVKANGNIDLGNIKDALPIDKIEISGKMNADLSVESDLKAINSEQYEKVNAQGNLGLSDFKFKSPSLPKGVDISKAGLKFSPKALELNPLDVMLGKSDVSLTGKVENYLQYLLSDGTVMGQAVLKSRYIDCDELMTFAGDNTQASQDTTKKAQPAQAGSEPLELPKNINFTFDTNVDKLTYDRLTVNDINGRVMLKNGIADLSNLSMSACGGKMVLTGQLQTPKKKNSKVKMKVDMTDVDINKMTGSFSIIDSLLPIAKSTFGNVNVGLDVTAELDQELSPILKTVNGDGTFSTANIELKGSEFQQKLSKLMGNSKYEDIDIKDCRLKYRIADGNVVVEPFAFKLFKSMASFSGTQGLDQTMNYLLSVPVPRDELASLIGKLGVKIGEGADIPIGIAIQGMLTQPDLKLDLSQATEMLKQEAKGVVTEKANEALDKAIDKIGNDKVKDAANKGKTLINGLLNKKEDTNNKKKTKKKVETEGEE